MKHVKQTPATQLSQETLHNDPKPKKSIWKRVFGKKPTQMNPKPTFETPLKSPEPIDNIDYRASFDSQVLPFITRQSTVLTKSERRNVIESQRSESPGQEKKIGIHFNQLIFNIFGEIPWETNSSWTPFRHPLQLSNSEVEWVESLPKKTILRETVTQKLTRIFHY